MAKFGVTKAYRYYADRYYLDRANRDTYIYRESGGNVGFSGVKILALAGGGGSYITAPVLTTTQRDALTAVEGMVIFNSTTDQLEEYDGSTWQAVGQVIMDTHAADLDAHHTKYTDAEAVIAAKTVKLDDLTAPDDTTDLDFSTTKHGLTPKGTNVGNFLKDDGTWAAAAGGATIVRKTADEIVNNSNVLQNDDGLLLAVAANEVWLIEYSIRMSAFAASDFRYAFVIPSGATFVGLVLSSDVTTEGAAGSNLTTLITVTVTDGTWILTYRGLYIGGANAGNVQLQWAQNTAVAEDTKVLVNSYLIAQKLSA